MVRESLATTQRQVAPTLLLKTLYTPRHPQVVSLKQLSSIAQLIIREQSNRPLRVVSPSMPEVIALRLLDFLSSKKGYIRRKGRSFRTPAFYRKILPRFVEVIRQGKPLRLSTLCFCTTLANTRLSGESLYPHMATYLALENIHKIASAMKNIYPPGAEFYLGFEGRLFQPLYFHSDNVLSHYVNVLQTLNTLAHKNVVGTELLTPSPVHVVDALWMIEQAFECVAAFKEQVMRLKDRVTEQDMRHWQAWYRRTVSGVYFPSVEARNRFVNEQARWRRAVYWLQNQGGTFGGGLKCFASDVIPFTPTGRHSDMLALQMVPENSFLPHQRIITYDPATNRWRMKAYEDIRADAIVYAPRYVKNYLYPFYFEKIN